MSSKEKFTFTCNDVRKRSFDFFEDMWKKKELCDITFHIGNDIVYAHKIIITAAIPYLRDMVSKNDQEGKITLPNTDPEAFRSVIEYSYTCKLEIDEDNASSILSVACYLRIDEIKQACCDFLAANLDSENLTSVRDLASKLNCLELLSCIDSHVKRNFSEVAETEQFLNWTVAYVKDIIGGNDLYVATEQIILDAAIKWVKFCPEERKDELPNLLRKIRLHEIDTLHLVDIVETEELVRTSVPVRDLIDEAKHYNLFPHRRKSNCSFATEPRKALTNTPEYVEKGNLRIYTLEVQLKHTVQSFDFQRKLWEIKGSEEFYFDDGSTVVVRNKMYFFHWEYTFQYDQADNSWKYINELPTPARYMEAVALNGKIYVIGGKVNPGASGATRCFDPEVYVWTEVKSMSIARWGASSVALSGNIYVLGGRNKSLVFDSVETYDPETNKWKPTQPMLTKRCFVGAASVNGKIYVCGGTLPNGRECVATAELYDPMKNRWTFIKPMNSPRREFTLLPFNSKLYALGGVDREMNRQYSCEIYHPKSDSWSTGSSTDSGHEICGAVLMSTVNN